MLLNVIEKNCSVSFSGKINLLSENDKRFLGSIYLSDGKIVNATFGITEGENGLFSTVYKSHTSDCKVVTEPELIISSMHAFSMSYDDLISFLNIEKENLSQMKKLIPPNDLHILIRPEFVTGTEELTNKEFQLLSTISDFSKVEDIYRYSLFLPSITTSVLVALRKKSALKVFKR